jgi:hypothetical protein
MNRLTCAEAAQLLGITPATLYRRLARARSRGALQVGDPVGGVWLLTESQWRAAAGTARPKGFVRGNRFGRPGSVDPGILE